MSRASKTRAFLAFAATAAVTALIGFIGLTASPAHAGVDTPDNATTGSTVSPSDLNRSGDTTRARKPRVLLKCYQEGRLVLETPDVNLVNERQGSVITLNATSNGQPAVQLLDLKQGLCTIETRQP